MIGGNAELPAVLFLPGETLRSSELDRTTETRERYSPPEDSFRRQVDIRVVRDHHR